MASALKDIYSTQFINSFLLQLQHVYPALSIKQIAKDILCKEWHQLELKQRWRHISICMKKHLPEDYNTTIQILVKLCKHLQNDKLSMSFEYMFIPDFIEVYGVQNYSASIKAIESITQFTSCEYAIRPFLNEYPQQTMQQMYMWSMHKHINVRRFASEGCRPKLPWALGVPFLKKDVSAILPILENLMNDASEFVQKSVANNLNDISKEHPQIVIDIIKKWKGKSKNIDWIVKHASRTLFKQGNASIMKVFGYHQSNNFKLNNFNILDKSIYVGEYINFNFQIQNLTNKKTICRIEYAIYFRIKNGTHNKKVFKISEKEIDMQTTITINRRQSFKPISTRVYYKGVHYVSIILNGIEGEKSSFELLGI